MNFIPICIGIAGYLLSNIAQGPIEVAIGIAVGLGWGFISACIPHRDEVSLDS